MTREELIEVLVDNAQPYYQGQTRVLAETLYDFGYEEGQKAPRKRGPKPTKAQQDAADELTRLGQELELPDGS